MMVGKKPFDQSQGLRIPRYFSKGRDPYKVVEGGYSPRDVVITNDKGEVIEELKGAVFPNSWSQHSASTVATKYFRRKDIPKIGGEKDLRQLVGRVAKTVSQWGVEQGYFDGRNGNNLERELVALTIAQMGAFNSPVWFNVGLDSYGVYQKANNNFYIDSKTGKVEKADNYYKHPQGSACFISHPEDSIRSMMEVAAIRSSEVFRNGSGIGSSWYRVRSAGEQVAGGGKASGAKRFMDVQDTVARVIKSGGKTRRAAVLQNIPVWHPDMIEVIREKWQEEQKARVLVEAGSPGDWESHTVQNLRGQNVNISVLCDDEFWRAYENNESYKIKNVLDGSVAREVPARSILEMMAFAAHGCGDPGIQNFDTINKWNTCKNSGKIWGSNPCSEYMFLNNSACNLASLNLMRFRKEGGDFDIDSFDRAVDSFLTSQDIMVSQLSYPSEEIALNSHLFRPLGLGFANLGAYVMSLGLPYDSEEARDFAAAVTSRMTAEAYLQSTKLSEKLGSFDKFEENRVPMLEVIGMHRKAAKKIPARNGLEELVYSTSKKWDEVIERGNEFGFRNAQVTLLAPTGTIGFMMGCDTTGCEPEFALKKYKELAGGGSMEIVNGTIPMALGILGYSPKDIENIEEYINQNSTVEGCDLLRPEHLSVFDCAVTPKNGTRVIHPKGHLRMLGALQPHLSGAISKTLNCPNNITVEEMMGMMHQSWGLGIKAAAFYRNGAKVAQPLTTRSKSNLEILSRGEREHLPAARQGITQKIKVGGISLFLRTGEYPRSREYLEKDGYRGILGEVFIDSLERGSEVNRLLNELAIQFSEKLQLGMSLEESLEVFEKAGASQISGFTDHPFIKMAKGPEGFIRDWLAAHYLGDITDVKTISSGVELRPLPQDLRVYNKFVPELHLIPTVAGENFYEGVPSLEETIQKVSKTNFWEDKEEGLDTRRTLERIKKTRKWKTDQVSEVEDNGGKITGQTCEKCGGMLISDGKCWKCPHCKVALGGCSG